MAAEALRKASFLLARSESRFLTLEDLAPALKLKLSKIGSGSAAAWFFNRVLSNVFGIFGIRPFEITRSSFPIHTSSLHFALSNENENANFKYDLAD